MENYKKDLKCLLSSVEVEKYYTIDYKMCFGAIAGYVDGKIFISCGKFGIALKLPEKIRHELMEHHNARPLRYFKNGHIKKEYVVIPSALKDDMKWRKKLIKQSIAYVCNSP